MRKTTNTSTSIPIKMNCHFIRVLLLALALLCSNSIVHGETNSLLCIRTARMPFVVDSSKLLFRCGGDGDDSNQGDDEETETLRMEEKEDACDHNEEGESQVIQEDSLQEPFEGNIETNTNTNNNVERNEDTDREQDDLLEENASVFMEVVEEDPMQAGETRILNEEETQTDSFVSSETLPDSVLDDNPIQNEIQDDVVIVSSDNTGDSVEIIQDSQEEWFFNNQIIDFAADAKQDNDEDDATTRISNGIEINYDDNDNDNNDISLQDILHLNNYDNDDFESIVGIDEDENTSINLSEELLLSEMEEQQSSSYVTDTTIITDDMRQILESLSYTTNEINIMKPNIASTVIQFKLRRPPNGMPKNWGVSSEEEEETYNGEEKGDYAARKLKRQQIQKIAKRILLSSAGIACSVLVLQKSFRTATTAEENVSTLSSTEELETDDSFMEQQLEENNDLSENSNAILDDAIDETWFDQLITLVAKKLQNLFRRENY